MNNPSDTSARRGKLASIQILRAIAALMVMIYHLGLIKTMPAFLSAVYVMGRNGVDLFFVISGFIIAYVHAGQIGKKEYLPDFLWKRFVRIYPSYWVLTILVILIALIVPGTIKAYKWQPMELVQSFTLLHLTPAGILPVIPVGWTLFYEIKFYLFFGLLIWLPWRYGKWLAIATMGLTFWYAYRQWVCPEDAEPTYGKFFFHSSNWEFAAGCAACWLSQRPRPLFRPALCMAVFTFCFWAVSFFLTTGRIGYLCANMTFSIFGGLLVYAAVKFDEAGWKAGWFGRLAIELGNASYSLYLVHLIFYLFLTTFLKKTGWIHFNTFIVLGGAFMAAVLIGYVYYRVVEQFFVRVLRKKRKSI